jgi:hypothetical protein
MQVHTVFESLLDWDLFSVRIKEDQIERLPQVRSSGVKERVKGGIADFVCTLASA